MGIVPRVSVWPERRVGVVGTSLKIGGRAGAADTSFVRVSRRLGISTARGASIPGLSCAAIAIARSQGLPAAQAALPRVDEPPAGTASRSPTTE